MDAAVGSEHQQDAQDAVRVAARGRPVDELGAHRVEPLAQLADAGLLVPPVLCEDLCCRPDLSQAIIEGRPRLGVLVAMVVMSTRMSKPKR